MLIKIHVVLLLIMLVQIVFMEFNGSCGRFFSLATIARAFKKYEQLYTVCLYFEVRVTTVVSISYRLG